MKFFISYKRSLPEDSELARFLVEHLRAAGHDVFIDTGMTLGVDWVEEIERRIAWCDFLVALLSEDALDSEMVQGEVRRAYHRGQRHGSPKILPVRVRYFGSLDYELDSYLARVQYIKWSGPEDNPVVLRGIEDAVAGSRQAVVERRGRERDVDAARDLAQRRDHRRPRPTLDPRAHVLADLALAPGDPFYLERNVDDVIARLAPLRGQTLAIKAAHQMGKTSLLMRYLSRCQAEGKRTVFLDFTLLSDFELGDFPKLLGTLAEVLVEGLDLAVEIPTLRSPRQLTSFIKRTVLDAVAEPVVLAFDDVDELLGRDYQKEFFRMLRAWSDSRAIESETWGRVDLALVLSTEPTRLIEGSHSSPFSVATPIEPQPFDAEHVACLSSLFGKALSREEIDQLHLLTGGHPFLTRLAFYRLVGPGHLGYSELLARAADEDGPFADHLAAKLFQISQFKGLRRAFHHVIKNRSIPPAESYDLLRAAGFVRHEGDDLVPANLLYARFFKRYPK